MDVLVTIIFVISASIGFRQGFIRTLIHTLGWALSLVLAFIFYTSLDSFLRANTNYYNLIYDKVSDRVSSEGFYAVNSFSTNMPAILSDFIDPIKNTVTTAIATGIADFIFKLISFLIVAIILRLVLYLITLLFSKKNNRGILGFIDGVFGLAAGILKGIMLIFLLLALLIPLIGLYPDSGLIGTLESSKLAGVLYDNNYLLLILKSGSAP